VIEKPESSVTRDLIQSAGLTDNRRFFGRLAEGVSCPPWSARAAGVAVVISFGGIYGLPAVFGFVSPGGWDEANFLWPTLIAHFPLLCCLVYLARKAGTSVEVVFGLRGTRFGKTLVSGLLLFVLGEMLMATANAVLSWIGLGTVSDVREHLTAPGSFFEFTDTVAWTPLCEELACRGLLYTSLRTRFGIGWSSVVTAAIFAFMHVPDSMAEAGAFFFPAVLSSLWYERTRSLWPNIIEHALHNGLISALLIARADSWSLAIWNI
jgi:membrane protease YdiL (CAAX protease family)